MSTVDIIIFVEVIASFVFAVAFVIVYMFSPWYTTVPGRALMNLSVAIAAALGLSVARIFWRGHPFWLDVLRVSVFGYIVVALAVQLVVLLHYRRRHNREESRR